MAKFLRKGRNICAVDCWLDTLGYYRKNVAYDETCLFRSVSEQLFNCQVYHEKVRKECVTYAREHFEEFSHLDIQEEEWHKRLDHLEMHMLYCGQQELEIVSKKYNCDIIIFDASKQEVTNITRENYEKTLLLCLMEEDHYDVVYKKEHIADAGFCQSIAYKILYENVFGISNVDEIVNNMLYAKHNLVPSGDAISETDDKNEDHTDNKPVEKTALVTDITSQQLIAPFPFKVAKALDPNIYRNIEYDAWGELRRELRLGEWYYGDDKLILGTRCIYTDTETQESFECYIQDIMKDQDQCIIYLTKLAQKRIVSYSQLSPEDNAAAWPLPYRFTKSVFIAETPRYGVPERASYKSKKRTKRRTKSESSLALAGNKSEPIENVNSYVGVPLQMQSSKPGCPHPISEVSIETQTEFLPEMIPLEDVLCGRAAWEAPPYLPSYVPPTPTADGFMWPPPLSVPPPTQYHMGLKPVIASAPVTPDIVPYQDSNVAYYCSYPLDGATYQVYPQWSPSGDNSSTTSQVEDKNLDESNKQVKEQHETIQSETSTPETAPDQHTKTYRRDKLKIFTNVSYPTTVYNNSTPQLSPMYTNLSSQSPIYTSLTQQSPVIINMSHQTPICANLTTQSPICSSLTPNNLNSAIEMYPSVMPLQPVGNPFVYGHSSVPEMPEMMITTSPVVFTPQMDMQYVSPGPYVYPPTPPASWFPPGVNTQGFIFPRPN